MLGKSRRLLRVHPADYVGLTDDEELAIGTSSKLMDTDGDGASDFFEYALTGFVTSVGFNCNHSPDLHCSVVPAAYTQPNPHPRPTRGPTWTWI